MNEDLFTTTVGAANAQPEVTSSVMSFNFDGWDVRVTKDANDEPWFVAKDVCEYFGEANYRRATSALELDEKGVSQIATPGGLQNMTIVNESGLYSLLFSMQPQKARGVSEDYISLRQEKLSKFKRWVTHEVLPSIRKHGAYMTPETLKQALLNPDTLLDLALRLKSSMETVERQKMQIAENQKQLQLQAPAVEYCNDVLSASNLHTVNSVAVHLGISAKRLNQFLVEQGWIYKQGDIYCPSCKIRDKGYCDYHVVPYVNRDGDKMTREHLKWTENGRRAIIELWNRYNSKKIA